MNVTLGGLVQVCFVTIVYSAKTLLFWQRLGAGRPGWALPTWSAQIAGGTGIATTAH